jgi:opacity protein-like surface antigen
MRKLLIATALMLMLTGIGLAEDFPKWEVFGGFSLLNAKLNIGSELLSSQLMSKAGPSVGLAAAQIENTQLTKGFDFSLTRNINPWLGIKADFTGHIGTMDINDRMSYREDSENTESPDENYYTYAQSNVYTGKVDYKRYSFLFGPEFSYRGNSRVRPFVHMLFGFTKLTTDKFNVDFTSIYDSSDWYSPVDIETTTGTISGKLESNTAFGMSLGGGLDIKAGKHASIRLIELDYVPTYNNLKGTIAMAGTTVQEDEVGVSPYETFSDTFSGKLSSPRMNNLKISFGVVFSF